MPAYMSDKTYLKRCLEKRCSLKIKTILHEIQNIKKRKTISKHDSLKIVKLQRLIFALEILIKMDWNETIKNIVLFRDIFKNNFEYSRILNEKSADMENSGGLNSDIKKYLDEPDPVVVEKVYNKFMDQKEDFDLSFISDRLKKV